MRTMRVLIGVVCVVCLLLTSSALSFDLIGHRGARGLAPENTLPSFARALLLGLTVLELDTAITKDGVIVISHDPSLNPNITRDKDGKWLAKPGPAIHSLTFNELQQYDVGRLKPNTNYAKSSPNRRLWTGRASPGSLTYLPSSRNPATTRWASTSNSKSPLSSPMKRSIPKPTRRGWSS